MNLPRLAHSIAKHANSLMLSRYPDFIIGGASDPYMLRWFVVPRNPVANVYLHRFLRSDDDRAHHDHPWPSLSLMLEGEATEHTIAAGGVHRRRIIRAGNLVFRTPRYAHRIELHAGECLTLFMTGPRIRTWGFHCPTRWVPWKEFTAADDKGSIGPGCGGDA